MIYIYVLIDPRTMEVRYVGQTNNPKERYFDHVSLQPRYLNKPNQKHRWVQALAKDGFKPIMEILFTCQANDANQWEHCFYKLFKGCELLNSAVIVKETLQFDLKYEKSANTNPVTI